MLPFQLSFALQQFLEDEVRYDDMENILMILAMKEMQDKGKKKRRQGSKVGRLCIPRNRALSHSILMKHYFAEVCTYPGRMLLLNQGPAHMHVDVFFFARTSTCICQDCTTCIPQFERQIFWYTHSVSQNNLYRFVHLDQDNSRS